LSIQILHATPQIATPTKKATHHSLNRARQSIATSPPGPPNPVPIEYRLRPPSPQGFSPRPGISWPTRDVLSISTIPIGKPGDVDSSPHRETAAFLVRKKAEP